jgi:hypothetical protein
VNYEPLIERDLDAIPAAAHAFLETHTTEELWMSVTRFAVLAYAPSQHAKRAVMACRATLDVREELGDPWPEMIIACARYAATSRQPWSEPPLLDPPEASQGDVEELRAAITAGERLRAERWLSARLADAEEALRDIATGDALLLLDAAIALLPHLGEKGRYALFRMPVWEMVANGIEAEEDVPMETLVARAVDANGSPDAVTPVFVQHVRGLDDRPLTRRCAPPFDSLRSLWAGSSPRKRGEGQHGSDHNPVALLPSERRHGTDHNPAALLPSERRHGTDHNPAALLPSKRRHGTDHNPVALLPSVRGEGGRRPDEGLVIGREQSFAASTFAPLEPYDLARDYAQTLIAHGYHLGDDVLHAVHHNLEHGESFAAWSFA